MLSLRNFGQLLRRAAILLLVLLILLLGGCTQTSVATQPPVNISIAGSTAFFPVLFDLTEAFSNRNPHVIFDVRGGGSGFGESQLRQGKIDLAATSYEIAIAEESRSFNEQAQNVAEIDAAPSNGAAGETSSDGTSPPNQGANVNESAGGNSEGGEAMRIPIGLDGIAVITNRNNPIEGVTLNELRDIFGGRILDWAELGAEAGEIQLVIREDGSGARALFESRVMRDKQVSLTAVIMPTNADVLRYVALYPTAVGYISRGYVMAGDEPAGDETTGGNQPAAGTEDGASSAASANQNSSTTAYLESLASERSEVSVVAIDSQMPTRNQILDQQYYLVHPLYLTTSGKPSGWLSLFIDFVLSPSGQEIVSRYHAPVR